MRIFAQVVTIIFLLYAYQKNFAKSNKSFIISFQSQYSKSMKASTDDWIEFTNEFPSTREFTACHWIRPNYFNKKIGVMLWSYCTKVSANTSMGCVQLELSSFANPASRDMLMHLILPFNNSILETEVKIQPFHHRTWVHFCWSLSSITGEQKVFYDGKRVLYEKDKVGDSRIILGKTNEEHDTALKFGQEPDKMRGQFHPSQAVIGELSEFNLWNYVLKDETVFKMATCKDMARGNIVSWNKTNIITHKVVVDDIEDSRSFCHDHQKRTESSE